MWPCARILCGAPVSGDKSLIVRAAGELRTRSVAFSATNASVLAIGNRTWRPPEEQSARNEIDGHDRVHLQLVRTRVWFLFT